MAKFHPFYCNKDGALNWKIIFVIPFVIFTIWISYLAYNYTTQGIAAESWQRVDAEITNLDLRKRANTGGSMSRKIFISYDYVIGGKSYSGDRVAFGYLADRLDYYSNLSAKISDKKTSQVYVDPNNPETSTLISGISNGTLVIVGIAIYSLASCMRFFLFIVGIEMNNKQHGLFFLGAIVLIIVLFMQYYNTLNVEGIM